MHFISRVKNYRSKKYKSLLSTSRNNSTPSKQKINELLKTYPHDLLNFDYLEQYWVFDTELKEIIFFLCIIIINNEYKWNHRIY